MSLGLKSSKLLCDRWFYYVLKIFGITYQKTFLQKAGFVTCTRNFFSIPAVLLYLSFAYSASCFGVRFKALLSEHFVNYLISLFFPIILWHQFQANRPKFLNFMMHLEYAVCNFKSCSYEKDYLFDTIMFGTVIYPVLFPIAFLFVSIHEGSHEDIVFWLLGCPLDNCPILRILLMFLGVSVYFSLKFLMLTFLSILYIGFSKKLSNAIQKQTEILEIDFFSPSFYCHVKTYHLIVKSCLLFNDAIKLSVFLMFCLFFAVTYSSLGLVLGLTKFTLTHEVECTLILIYSVILMTCLISSLSAVPDAMSRASLIFQNIYNKEIIRDEFLELEPPGFQRLMTIKALSKLKPVYITAWDIMKVDRSLLLSTFGCILTFGILIIQLQTQLRNEIETGISCTVEPR
ncbi:uncharacterized protein CDAR_12631 [Caerostris darwini]|uniref:Gustatory receptor n=1 Tax=Caerostris darwini TaxID=1538125 RepID=A0AAV4QYY8_9ARAC|nr:uncharacterized protein CDAR_12631 [Caerostris darwini]